MQEWHAWTYGLIGYIRSRGGSQRASLDRFSDTSGKDDFSIQPLCLSARLRLASVYYSSVPDQSSCLLKRDLHPASGLLRGPCLTNCRDKDTRCFDLHVIVMDF